MALLEDLLVTLLWGTKATLTHPGILLPSSESTSDTELKNIVKQTQRVQESRETLGHSPKVWKTLTETLRAGNEQLIANKHHLLPKIWDITILGRNLLAAKEKAQNLAAEGFEAEIRRLVSVCIEKASKPVPPDLDKANHEKELQIKGGYKKVLITALQFLNNIMSNNETRKLHLWLHMFGTPSGVSTTPSQSAAKASGKGKNKSPSRAQPASGSGVGVVNSTATGNANSHTETAAKCNSLSAGFNAKYYKPGFLTDIPRLLQPDEIEPLHMVLQSGVVAFEGSDQAMQAVRCKLMLAQGPGRNLLREVFVFLGAWEVDEEDFCYRVIAQVVEAILLNGLIPYAYESFRDEKDIVTPAQSVLLKLLVSVYRPPESLLGLTRHDGSFHPPSPISLPSLDSFTSSSVFGSSHLPDITMHEAPPPAIDDTIPVFFMNIFRKQVLPPVIKIVQLQGAIKNGKEKKEAFEFSLWDLDRIYEGVYQFLELMVLFSEDAAAKAVLLSGEYGLVADLVQFLGELDMAIPPYIAIKTRRPSDSSKQLTKEDNPHKVESAYMVERPFDVLGDGIENGDGDDESDASDERDPDRDLADPDDFTWPNIKRHIVSLLSSFSWHNKGIQDLIREKGGVELVLNQCKVDDDNPYIREHAILCIRSLLQGNPANQKIVEGLNARGTVPSEVLDKHGYEPVIDEKGRVRLQRVGEKPKT